jgi:hypothetical protein
MSSVRDEIVEFSECNPSESNHPKKDVRNQDRAEIIKPERSIRGVHKQHVSESKCCIHRDEIPEPSPEAVTLRERFPHVISP